MIRQANPVLPPVSPGLMKKTALLASLVGLTTVIGVVVVWWVINDRAQNHTYLMIENVMRINELLIRQDISNRLAALDRLAQRWSATGGSSRSAWEADAARYLADMPGFQAIEWADNSSHIRWVVPLAGNEGVVGLDIAQTDEARIAIIEARETGRTVLAGPFELVQGGLGATAYAPIFIGEQYDGAIVGVLRLSSWLATVIGDVQSTDHHVRILLQGSEVYRNDNDAVSDAGMTRKDFEDHGLSWTILIAPRADFVAVGYAESSTIVLVVGLLFSVLAAVVVYLALVARVRSRQLHDTAVRLETLFQNFPGMAYRCTGEPNRPMEFVSDGCRKLSGYVRSDFETLRVSWGELTHPDDRDCVAQEIKQAIEDAAAFEIEYRILTLAGRERWVWERGRVVKLDGSNDIRLEGFISDISRQRDAEAEARQQRDQLAHMDRIDMLGEMASGIAHEINQPLTAISLFAQAGNRLFAAGKQDKLPEVFENLSRHALRAGAVIERMQAMARRQESKKEVVDCNALVEDVVRLAETEAHIRDMTIEVETESELPAVNVDTVQIQQVALNLLRNAMEAMRSAECREGDVVRLQTKLLDDGDVEVAVIDKGGGVSAAITEILFTPFSTTKESGMGMGLSISRAIIKAHGGHLDFHNNDAGGATFYFTLPAAGQGKKHE